MAIHQDHITLGSLLAIALGLVKVLEVLITWIFEKVLKKDKDPPVVKLDDSALDVLKDIKEEGRESLSLLKVSDEDGVPLVYNRRSLEKEFTSNLRDISHSQERMSNILDKMENKLESVYDKTSDVARIVQINANVGHRTLKG